MKFPSPGDGPVLVTGALPRSWRRGASAAGWTVAADGCPSEPWDLTGVLVHTDDPETAALVIARGGSAAFAGDADSPAGTVLVEDVLRVGGAVWRGGNPTVGSSTSDNAVDADTADLMAALIEGESVAAAARTACMSLRTAQRRLDALRKQYGVTTTAGVVAVWARDHGQDVGASRERAT